ncbi:MAG: AraC family transcriptional regulator [Lachnospiraceae bacterium]|nr:AraC family transcriptional regulator [Lachnospiraceae bacterium]MDD7176450.1 AraC family transcriptional regulator [bacterium]MDY5517884.1 AraC family transcriptional regulator [Lachnospiraceae bacterium]
MNFAEMYQNCITIRKHTSVVQNLNILIPNLYSYENLPISESERCSFLHLLAAGNLFCEDLFSFSFQPMDCCMLLYTTAGSGTLTANGRPFNLTTEQILFFDCNQRFSLQSAILPWSFKIFFLSGEQLHLFQSLFRAHTAPCFTLPEFSQLRRDIGDLLGIATEVTLPAFLQMQQLLNSILTTLYLSAQTDAPGNPADIPTYLIEMKDTFDHHYADPFSLDIYQDRYHISKYRLCREFSAQFGEPPLRYLNEKRLETAKKYC